MYFPAGGMETCCGKITSRCRSQLASVCTCEHACANAFWQPSDAAVSFPFCLLIKCLHAELAGLLEKEGGGACLRRTDPHPGGWGAGPAQGAKSNGKTKGRRKRKTCTGRQNNVCFTFVQPSRQDTTGRGSAAQKLYRPNPGIAQDHVQRLSRVARMSVVPHCGSLPRNPDILAHNIENPTS